MISDLINELYKRSLLTSWRQFSKRLGVTHQTVGLYRKGTSLPQGEVSKAIAAEANVTVDELNQYREGKLSLEELLDSKRENPIPFQEVKRSVPYYSYDQQTELLIEISHSLRTYGGNTVAARVQSSVGTKVNERRMYSSGESNEFIHLSYKQQRRLKNLLIETGIENNWTRREIAESRDIEAYSQCEPHYVNAGVDRGLCRSIFKTEMNGVHFTLIDELATHLYKVNGWTDDRPTINRDETYTGQRDTLLEDLENHCDRSLSVR